MLRGIEYTTSHQKTALGIVLAGIASAAAQPKIRRACRQLEPVFRDDLAYDGASDGLYYHDVVEGLNPDGTIKTFGMPKIQTMFSRKFYESQFGPVADEAWHSKDSPGIPRKARAVRKHKTDELPQLACVLSGKVALVGGLRATGVYRFQDNLAALTPKHPDLAQAYFDVVTHPDIKPALGGPSSDLLTGTDDRSPETTARVVAAGVRYDIEQATLWTDLEHVYRTGRLVLPFSMGVAAQLVERTEAMLNEPLPAIVVPDWAATLGSGRR